MIKRFIILGALAWLMTVGGWLWSLVSFILFIAKDTEFNFWALTMFIVGIVLLVVNYVFAVLKS